MKLSLPLSLILISGLLLSAPVSAQSNGSLEQRVQRLERLIENQILKEMLTRLEDIQQELGEMRGQQEVHAHKIQRLMSRQRELYMDVDRRLAAVEAGGGVVPAAPIQAGGTAQSATQQAGVSAQAAVSQSGNATAQSASDAVAEQKAYEKAFNLLTEGRYEQAQTSFAGFLKQFPQGSHAANAQYWLAESHYLSRNFDQALKEFQVLLSSHPDSAKAPKAKLKIGFVYFEKGDWAKARKALEAVTKQHPGTASARLAQQRLTEMKKEKR